MKIKGKKLKMVNYQHGFIKDLILVAVVTVVSMFSLRFYVNNYILTTNITPEYTTTQSSIHSNLPKANSISPNSN